MTSVWITIAALCAGTIAIKATGPVALGGRQPGERTVGVVSLFAPALLAALIVYETLNAGNQSIKIDERIVGVGAAGLALALRAPMGVVVVGAAAATALARAVG